MSSEIEGVLIYLEARDVKAITEVLNIAEKLKLEVLSMQFYKYEDVYSLLLTLKYNLRITKFTETVNKVKNVKKVKLLAELPTVRPRPILTEMVRRVLEAFNNAARVFMFHIGLVVGRTLKEIFPTLPSEEVMERMLLLVRGSGLGEGDLTKYSPPNRCVIEMKDSFECAGLKSKEPASYFFRGVISGLLSQLWRVDVNVSEVKCVALGDKYCEFLAIPSRKPSS